MIHRRAGFSLLELSVVIAIIALVSAFGISLGSNALKAADRVNVQQRLIVLQNALDSYAATTGYLPCPANRDQTPSGNPTTFGLEARTGTTCSGAGVIAVSGGYIGMIPVRTLGLPDSYAADVWSHKFTYAVSAPHVASAVSYNASNGTLTVKTGDRWGGTNYPVTSSVTDRSLPSTPAKITYGPGATYVVVSHGRDGAGAIPLKASVVGVACNFGTQNDVENCNNDDVFWDTTFNDSITNTAQFFDDYIVWGSNSRVRAPLTVTPAGCVTGCEAWCAPCAGVMPNTPSGAPAALTNPTLCQKIITSSSPCSATCVWSGAYTSGGDIVRCP